MKKELLKEIQDKLPEEYVAKDFYYANESLIVSINNVKTSVIFEVSEIRERIREALSGKVFIYDYDNSGYKEKFELGYIDYPEGNKEAFVTEYTPSSVNVHLKKKEED